MLKLDRRTLAQFLPTQQAIAAFEKMFTAVDETFPTTIDEAQATAVQAQANAAVALTMLAVAAQQIEHLAAAPAVQAAPDPGDDGRRAHLGTLSGQNHDAVEITGGTAAFDAGTAAAPSLRVADAATGFYRSGADVLAIAVAATKLVEFSALLVSITGSLAVSQQLRSTVATGTAPLAVASTTKVDNLHVEHAAQADALTAPSTFPAAATDLPTCIALANALRAAAISKGL